MLSVDYLAQRQQLYSFLVEHQFARALHAMRFAEPLYSGLRKDGLAPSFSHPLWIATTLKSLIADYSLLDHLMALAFLHDLAEDHAIHPVSLIDEFGYDLAYDMWRLTKKYQGVALEPEIYFTNLSETFPATIVKGVDRLHNLSTMHLAFAPRKQISYINETLQWHLPLLRRGASKFPTYRDYFQTLSEKIMIQINSTQVQLLHTIF